MGNIHGEFDSLVRLELAIDHLASKYVPLAGDTDLLLGVLAGDVDSSGTVTLADVLAVRDHTGQALADDTLAFDVDASGSITGSDMNVARNRLGRTLP